VALWEIYILHISFKYWFDNKYDWNYIDEKRIPKRIQESINRIKDLVEMKNYFISSGQKLIYSFEL
jgi:hypothetical protein